MSEKKSVLIPNEGETIESKFGSEKIRKQFHLNEWWWCVSDVVNSLIETKGRDVKDETAYWRQLKKRLKEEGAEEIVTNCHELKIPSKKDGKHYPVDCLHLEGILRIIQSVPSKNAEPLKRWLAKTGFERIQEQNNPDLTIKRAILYYELQGRDKQWIQNRIDGQFTRNELTGEWKQRGVQDGQEYATLTNIISQETFGVSVSKHKEIKSLKRENLRDNMTNIELIFQRLGEEYTILETKKTNAIGFNQNKKAARTGGQTAGAARKAVEEKTGDKVVSSDKFVKNIKQDNKDEDFESEIKKIALSKKN